MRLFFFEQIDEDRGVGKGSIGEQARSVEYVEFVYSEGQYLFFNACQIVAGSNCLQLTAQLIG